MLGPRGYDDEAVRQQAAVVGHDGAPAALTASDKVYCAIPPRFSPMTRRLSRFALVSFALAAASWAACSPTLPASGARHDVDVAVPMRDGVVLRAEVLRPAADGRYPHAGLSHAVRRARGRGRLHDLHPRRRTGLRGRGAGRARPLPVGRRVPALRARRQGRLRHHRVGRGTAVVRRQRRHLRLVVSRRRAVAGGDGAAAAPEGHGAGDDLLDAAELLLQLGCVGHVLDVVDLVQHRAGRARPEEPAGASDRRGGARRLARDRAEDAGNAAARSPSTS